MQRERELLLKEILSHEQIVLSACNFKIDILLVNEYADRYLRLMYPSHMSPQSPLRVVSNAVCNDSCYTYANLCFETYSVALACLLIASQMLNLPLPFIDVPDQATTTATADAANSQAPPDRRQLKRVRNPNFDMKAILNHKMREAAWMSNKQQAPGHEQ